MDTPTKSSKVGFTSRPMYIERMNRVTRKMEHYQVLYGEANLRLEMECDRLERLRKRMKTE